MSSLKDNPPDADLEVLKNMKFCRDQFSVVVGSQGKSLGKALADVHDTLHSNLD